MAQEKITGHAKVETSNFLLILLILVVVIFGGLVEIVPLFFQKSTTQPIAGLKPYTALELAGRDIYQREGCYLCHSQMIRPFRAEALRYGPYSVPGEFVYDHPFQWGSKRTGPDLARVGGRYSDDWQHRHLIDPRSVVPESVMPAYPWLAQTPATGNPIRAAVSGNIRTHMSRMKALGVPYTDKDLAEGPQELEGKTELDALVAYLQVLGTHRK